MSNNCGFFFVLIYFLPFHYMNKTLTVKKCQLTKHRLLHTYQERNTVRYPLPSYHIIIIIIIVSLTKMIDQLLPSIRNLLHQ